MAFNPMNAMQLKAAWDRFTQAHPKFPMFLKAVGNREVLKEGTIIEINITTAEGKNFATNVKLGTDDISLYESLKNLM